MFGKPILPMLLKESKDVFDDVNYLYELKFDGIRAIIHVGKSKFLIFNRYGKDITNKYPEIKEMQKYIKEDMIFDGEIVSFRDGKPNFLMLQKRNSLKNEREIKKEAIKNPVCFLAFDCLYKNKDITNETLEKRKDILNKIPDNDFFIKVKYLIKDGKKLFKNVQKLDLEGIVAKKISSLYYTAVRSDDWIKIKNYKKGIFMVGGFKENKEKISLFLGEYRKQNFYFVGKVAITKKSEFYKKLLKESLVNKSPFFLYDEEDVIFLKPKFRCEIVYLEKTSNGCLRQPVFKKGC